MIGLTDSDQHHIPLTAQLDEDQVDTLFFFVGRDNRLAPGGRAMAHFASKGHDLFACIAGSITIDNDRAVIDELWNPFIAAWYEGKDDPKLALLRFDAEEAQIWKDASSLVAGIKILFGADPKKSYKDKVAEIPLHKSAA